MKKILLLPVLLLVFFVADAQTKSYKRGVSYGYHSANDMQQFSEGISWWYNWAAQPDAAIQNTYQNYHVDFAPMAWNGGGINAVADRVAQDTSIKYILGFNEPNFIDQANMTPSFAAVKWPALQAIAENYDLTLVSPAVNYCGNCVSVGGTTYYSPFDWLDDFFDACTGCKVDHIALHWYGGGNSITGYIEDARQYNKPIWVTEFAAWDNSVNNPQDQKNYLAGTVNFLERDPQVYRYAWFIGRTASGPNAFPYIDLYGADGMLTELGQLYFDIPVYDPEMKFQVPGRIEVEEYYLMSGLFGELTQDSDGFMNLGWTNNNDWAEYNIEVQESGTYYLNARVAGINPGKFDLLVDGQLLTSVNTPNTGGWQSWITVSSLVTLQAGAHVLRMVVRDDGFNINWISITENALGIHELDEMETSIFPNPVRDGIVNVSLKTGRSGGQYWCTLMDVLGKEVFSQSVKLNRSNFQLNIQENGRLEAGIYFLQITGENGIGSAKLILQE